MIMVYHQQRDKRCLILLKVWLVCCWWSSCFNFIEYPYLLPCVCIGLKVRVHTSFWYCECMSFRYIATHYHMLNATEVAAGLYTVYVCMHTCMYVYTYVILPANLSIWPIVCRVHNPFTFLLFSSDLSTHQSASEQRVQQLQEKLEAANKMCQEKDQKIVQLETKLQSQEADIATLRCTLVVIWNTCGCMFHVVW